MLLKKLISFGLFLCLISGALAQSTTADTSSIQQLRIYEIFDHNRQAFYNRFRDHAYRIMKKYGFHIVSFWESRIDSGLRFVYLLDWKDRSAMKKSWAAFMADEEWKQIKKQTAAKDGVLVGSTQEFILKPTSYSPTRNFLLKPEPVPSD